MQRSDLQPSEEAPQATLSFGYPVGPFAHSVRCDKSLSSSLDLRKVLYEVLLTNQCLQKDLMERRRRHVQRSLSDDYCSTPAVDAEDQGDSLGFETH